jgi:hypothetical protein
MAGGLTRRQFLKIAGEKARGLFRTVVPFSVIVVGAWIAIVAIQVVRGITLEGWEMIGCVVLAAMLFAAVRRGAVRVYSSLPKRGKALCDAAGEAIAMLYLVAAGILVWQQFQAGETAGAVLISLFMLAWIVKRARKVYDQAAG